MVMKSTSKSEAKRVAVQKGVKSLPKLPKIPAKGLKVSKTITVTKRAPKTSPKSTLKIVANITAKGIKKAGKTLDGIMNDKSCKSWVPKKCTECGNPAAVNISKDGKVAACIKCLGNEKIYLKLLNKVNKTHYKTLAEFGSDDCGCEVKKGHCCVCGQKNKK